VPHAVPVRSPRVSGRGRCRRRGDGARRRRAGRARHGSVGRAGRGSRAGSHGGSLRAGDVSRRGARSSVRVDARSGTRAKLTVPAAAFALALASAFLHALWNVLLARERDPEPATAIAICTSVVVFAPVAALVWDVDRRVWPFIAVTSLLQLLYFSLLATAYRRAELSFVYPIARGLAPVLVLVV